MPSDGYDPDDFDDAALFRAPSEDVAGLAEETARWREWRARIEVEVRESRTVRESFGFGPAWRRPVFDGRPTFGFFSDYELAVTVRTNPKYL